MTGSRSPVAAGPQAAAEAAGPGLRIAFVTVGDSRNVRYWSGTPYHMAQALRRAGHRLEHIAPLHAPLADAYRLLAWGGRHLGLRMPNHLHLPALTGRYARNALRRIAAARPEVVVAVAGSPFVGRIPPGVPVVYASDATFRTIAGYYPQYRDLPRGSFEAADRMEAASIARADLVTYPSAWAAGSASRDYGAPAAKVHHIRWGANLAEPPGPPAAGPRPPGPLRLLLVGANWWIKGAAVAVEALAALRAGGIEAELTICGCAPPQPISAPGLRIIPFLDKNDPAQAAQLAALYRQADLFILPTRAECYGIVFVEAAAYGLPSVAPATGGVSGAVADGRGGLLLPEGADGAAYARAIAGLWADPARLAALRAGARHYYETEANWDAWAARITALMHALRAR